MASLGELMLRLTLRGASNVTSGLNSVMGSLGGIVPIGLKAAKVLGEIALAGIKTAMKFDQQMSRVKAISGATGDEFQQLRDKALEMGSKTMFTASETAQAFEYMGMAGWKTSDMMSGISGVMNLAAASGEDLALVSDIVTDGITAMGLTAKDTDMFVDSLAAAATNSNTNIAKMGETFKYATPLANSLGYNVKDLAVGIGLMANGGIKASQAGTSLRMGLKRLAAPPKAAAAAMDKYGISLKDANGKIMPMSQLMEQLRGKLKGLSKDEKISAASAIFGANAMSGWLNVINASDKDFNKLTKALQNSDGAAAKMAETMQDNLAGQITIIKSTIEGLLIKIGDQFTPILRELAKALQVVGDYLNTNFETILMSIHDLIHGLIVNGFQPFRENVLNLFPPEMKNTVNNIINKIIEFRTTLGNVVNAVMNFLAPIGQMFKDTFTAIDWTPILNGFNRIKESVPSLLNILKLLGVVLGIIVAVILGVVVGAVNALIAVFDNVIGMIVNVINIFTSLIDIIVGLVTGDFETLKQGFMNLFDSIISLVNNFKDLALDLIFGFVEGVIQFFMSLYHALVGGSIIPDLVNGIITWFTNLKDKAINLINSLKNKLINIFNTLKTGVTNIINKIKSTIINIFNSIKNKVGNVINTLKTNAINKFNSLKSSAVTAISNLRNNVINKFNSLKSSAVNAISNLRTNAINKFNSLKSSAVNAISNLRNNVINKFNSLKSSAVNAISNLRNNVINKFNSLKSSAGNVINNLKSSISSKFSTLASSALKWGSNIINNFVSGLKSKLSSVKTIASNISSTISGFIGFKSPTKEGAGRFADEWAPNLMDMFIDGINNYKGKLNNVMSDISNNMGNGLSNVGLNTTGNKSAIINIYADSLTNGKKVGQVLVKELNRMGVRTHK
jgi:TP901 family phage tail tape measure protein